MKVMVLVVGWGERMGELIWNCLKLLFKIVWKLLLQYYLECFVVVGFDDVVVNVFYWVEDIEDFLQGWYDDWMQVYFVIELELLEIGGGIYNVLILLGEQLFLVINGDVWIDYFLVFIVQKSCEFVLINDLVCLILVGNFDYNIGGDFVLIVEGWV